MSDAPFSSEARTTLASVLDELVPPRSAPDVPGAGTLGIGDYVEEKLGATAPLIAAGLAELHACAADRGAAAYAAMAPDERAALLEEVTARHPGFVESLVFHGYTGYYQHPRVVEAIGLEARPPHPEGYALESGDLSGLDAVRARGQLYRDA